MTIKAYKETIDKLLYDSLLLRLDELPVNYNIEYYYSQNVLPEELVERIMEEYAQHIADSENQ